MITNKCRNCWLWNHGCTEQPEECKTYDPIFVEEDDNDK